jgi:hypothetical protein
MRRNYEPNGLSRIDSDVLEIRDGSDAAGLRIYARINDDPFIVANVRDDTFAIPGTKYRDLGNISWRGVAKIIPL